MSLAARAAVLLSLAGLTSCASIVDGTNQSLSVSTTGNGGAMLPGARCALQNGKGTWYVVTPGSVTVHRAYSALNVSCTVAGYQTAGQTVESSTKAMYAGNVLFGGVIGLGTDAVTGAAYDYPQTITVPMQPVPPPASPVAAVPAAASKS